jgi:hypothetical protein
VFPIPVAAIVVFLVRQEGSDVDMPLSLPLICCLSIVDDGYKPVPVVSNVEDHVPIDKIGIFEHATNVIKIVPPDRLDNGGPSLDFVRRIWVVFHRLPQVLTRNDMHSRKHTSQYVKASTQIDSSFSDVDSITYGLPFAPCLRGCIAKREVAKATAPTTYVFCIEELGYPRDQNVSVQPRETARVKCTTVGKIQILRD